MLSLSPTFAQACIDAITPSANSRRDLQAGSANTAPSGGDKNIPLNTIMQLLVAAQQRAGNEDIGLLAYNKAHPGNLGLLGYAIMSSATVLDALRHMVEYHVTIGIGFCMFLDESATTVRIAGVAADAQAPDLPRAFIDAVTSITLGLIHWLVPTTRIMPLAAEFTYSRPADTRQLEALFGPHITFSAPVNALTFLRADCGLSIPTGDTSLQSIHGNHLKMQKQQLEMDSAVAQTRRVILQHLHQGKSLAMEYVLSSLNLTQRQLSRFLNAEGMCFQRLVDDVKHQQGIHLLTHTSMALKEVAYRLGFKNQSAFNKACERWFCMSPGSYRINARAKA